MASQPGRMGKYEILAEVGKGGMGTVFRARDPVLERIVALKVMAADVVSEPGMRDRFLRAARSAARLQHPNIVTVYEFGDVDGVPFIAMEFLEGENLAGALARGRFPDIAGKLEVMVQLCDALAYAHRHGVVHRDVKPTNVSILPAGAVKVVDFGIAWLEGATTTTRTGQVMGTPSYMAPEQFSGGVIDHHVDIWAVGVILYEVLAGARPFDASTVPALIYQIVHTDPRPLAAAGLPSRLPAVVARALEKDPRRRYGDLALVGLALREVLAELAGSALVGTAAVQRPNVAAPDEPTIVAPSLETAPPRSTAAARAVPFRPPATTPTPWRTAFVGDGTFGEDRKVQVIALSPDETLIAAGGTDGSIRLWDVETRMRVATLRNRAHLRTGTGSLTTSLAFSEDGSLLASGHLDGAVYLWELATCLELEVKLGHEGAIGGLALPPGGATLVSGGADATIKLWELASVRKGDARRTLLRQPDAVSCLAVAKSGRLVVSGHVNRSLRVHDTASGRLVATIHGHRAPLAALAVSAGGDLVASGDRDGAVSVHHVESKEQRGFHKEHGRAVASLAFFPAGDRLASVAMDNTVVIASLDEPGLPIVVSADAGEKLTSVCVTRDGRRLIAASADGQFRVWLARV